MVYLTLLKFCFSLHYSFFFFFSIWVSEITFVLSSQKTDVRKIGKKNMKIAFSLSGNKTLLEIVFKTSCQKAFRITFHVSKNE